MSVDNESNEATRHRRAPLALAVALSLAAGVASGQDRDEEDEERRDRRAVEEVVVVSQKGASAQSVQDIPVAMSAFDDTTIERIFAQDLRDLGRLAPNAQLAESATFVGFPNFFIRGIGVNGSTRTVDPAVGIFVDGIYMGFAPGTLLDTFDLETVEVLRGPQGTLFGRNVTGGAVVVRTKRPTGEFETDLKITAGNFNRIDAFASINFPIIENKLNGKVSVLSRNQDGFWEDNNGGFVDTSINPDGMPETPTGTKPDIDTVIIRPMLEWFPTDDIDVTFIGEYYRSRNGASNSRNIEHPDGRLAQTQFGYFPPDDPYEINHNLIEASDIEIYHVIADANWDLGHGIVSSVTGFRETLRFDTSTDFDGTPFTLFHFPDNEESQEQISTELRYASNFSQDFEFTTGLYYFDQEYQVGERRAILEVIDQAGFTVLEHDNIGFFAQGTYFFNDAWALTLGGRYTEEEKSIQFSPPGTCDLDFTNCTQVIEASNDWSNFSPKISVQYTPSDDALYYGSVTRGFRSGTFNQRAQSLATLGPADEEQVTSYEIGGKITFGDGRYTLNAAAFYSDYQDIQQIINETIDPDGPGPLPESSEQVLANAAQAEITGFELEFTGQMTDQFRLEASLGYVDASYEDFTGLDFDLDGDQDADDAAFAEDLEFVRVPELTGYLAGTYSWPLASGELALRGSYAYTGEFFNDLRNDPVIKQDAYGLLDASLTYFNDVHNYRVSLFGRNLTDEEYFEFAANVANIDTVTWGGMPRVFGVEFAWSMN